MTCAAIARPRLSWPHHLPTEAISENGWASWYCLECGHHCASSNLCDHCEAEIQEWLDEEDQ